MIDWHSHILPGVDDGSRSVAESISMIGMQASQGIDTAIATPHFLANNETVDLFIEKRNAALELLKAELPENSPKIKLGAEVEYYQGISRLDGLKKLRIDGSKLLLLEMPMATWSNYTVGELTEMSGRNDIRIILAHVDRYRGFQKPSVFEKLSENGILMQLNASYFLSFMTVRKAINLLEDGMVQFLGSDCHNSVTRPPRIEKAFDVIRNKLGTTYISQMDEYGHSVLTENQ